ncbi:hypothetical protein FPOA_06794 [Fusarium poae]|uniref:Uncharacterized protein n=1 Tax=Fusarium poae TaxID=36050 RepID=A0A1B8AJD8_FUSPO|nr:hypothetical protein FPOA_06794 [Fusarium poae]
MAALNNEWPSWLRNTNDTARVWVRDRFLIPLYQKIKEHDAAYTPATLLSSTDRIKITALRHYKQTVMPSHEAARVDIRLDFPNNQTPPLDLSIVFERTAGDAATDKRSVLIPLGLKPPALDKAVFYNPIEADEQLLSENAVELSHSTSDVNGQYFNLLFLAFVLQTLSSRNPKYDLYTTMCYWYAGSTLDCLRLALNKSQQEAESHITGGDARENSDHLGRATFAEFWWFKSPSFYKSQVPDTLHALTLEKPEVETPTEEFMGVVEEAETKTNTFRASLIFGDEDLTQPDNRKEFLRRHLVVDVPIEIGKRGDGYRLTPKPSPGFLLMDEQAVGSENANAGMLTEARELFYKENRFLVTLKALDAFWNGRYQKYELGGLVRSSIRHITIAISTDDDPELYSTMDILRSLDPSTKVRIVLIGVDERGESEESGEIKESGESAMSRVCEQIAPLMATLFTRFTDFKVHKQLLPEDADNNVVTKIFESL